MVVAMTACTKNAIAAPIQTKNGLPRVAITRLAIIVLSGSSPMKITGKTATAIARLTRHFFPPATGSTPGLPVARMLLACRLGHLQYRAGLPRSSVSLPSALERRAHGQAVDRVQRREGL